MVQQRVVGRGKSKQGVKPGAEDQRELARYKVEAVSRAVLLLEAFRQSPGLQTVETLSKRTGLAVPAVKALLVTLAQRGLVQRAPDDATSYRLGLTWLRLADVKRQQLDVREVAMPVLRRIRDAVNETVSLGIRIGTTASTSSMWNHGTKFGAFFSRGFTSRCMSALAAWR